MLPEQFLPTSFEDIRKAVDEFSGVESLRGIEKDAKQEWIENVLFDLNYEFLSREDKGIVRQYIQNETGYSRAQTARLLKASLLSIAEKKLQETNDDTSSIPPVHEIVKDHVKKHHITIGRVASGGAIAALFMLIAGAPYSTTADGLRFLNAQVSRDWGIDISDEDIARANLGSTGLTKKIVMTTGVRTVVSEGENKTVYPLLVQQEELSLVQGVAVAYERSMSSTVSSLVEKVAKRREQRVSERVIEYVQPVIKAAQNIPEVIQQIRGKTAESHDRKIQNVQTEEQRIASESKPVTAQDQRAGMMSKLFKNMAERRAERLARVPVENQIAIEYTAPEYTAPQYTDGPLYASAPSVWDALGSGRDGQVLMVTDGVPRWVFLNQSNVTDLAAHGNELSQRAGGNRGGGGGGGAGAAGADGAAGAAGAAGPAGPAGAAGPTLGIYDSLILESTGDLAAGNASGQNLYNLGLLTASGKLIVEGDVRFNSGITLSDITYLFPNADGSNTQVLTTDGNGNLTWENPGGATGSKWTDGGAITYMTSQADDVAIGGLDPSAPFYFDVSTSTFYSAVISGTTLHASSVLSTSGTLIVEGEATFNDDVIFGSGLTINGVTYIFPSSDGSASGKVLATDSNGNLSWTTASSVDTHFSGTGSLQNFFDNRYVSSAGDTMTGSLILNSTLTVAGLTTFSASITGTDAVFSGSVSGATLHASNGINSSGALNVEGNTFLQGTLSGNTIAGFNLTDCNGASNKIVYNAANQRFECETDNTIADTNTTYTAGEGLELTGTVFSRNAALTGTSLQVSGSLASSGTLAVEGDTTLHGTLSGNTIVGFNLTDCQGALDKIVYNASAQRFECGTDVDTDTDTDTDTHFSGTGALQAFFDERFVNTAGDTMTGSLIVNIETGTVAIEANGIISGTTLRAQDLLTTSGSLIVEGSAIFNSTITIGGVEYTFPVGDGSASGKVLATDGAGNLSWTDGGAGGSTYFAGQGLTLNGSNFLALNAAFTGTSLEILGTASGRIIYAADTLASSGTLVIEGAATFNSTVAIGGVTYTFPVGDGSATGKVLKTDGAGNLSWSDDDNTGAVYSAGQGLTASANFFSLNAAFTGTSLEILGTASGRIIHAQDNLTSSGSLQVDGNAEFKSDVAITEGALSDDSVVSADIKDDTIINADINSAAAIAFSKLNITKADIEGLGIPGEDTDTTYIAGNGLDLNATAFSLASLVETNAFSGFTLHAQDLLTTSGSLIVEGPAIFNSTVTIGGVAYTFPVGDGSASGKVLKTDGTGNLSWSDDDNTGAVYSAGQGLTASANFFSLNAAFTGTSLEILGTASGRIIYAADSLNSSGALYVEGKSYLQGTLSGNTLEGFGLSNCTGGSKLLWNATTKRFECGADQTAGTGLDQNTADARYVEIGGDTMTGSLILNSTLTVAGLSTFSAAITGTDAVFSGTVSGASLYAVDSLNSSGTLAVEGDTAIHGTLSGNTIVGFNLTDCQGALDKIVYNAAAQRFECGTDVDTDTDTDTDTHFSGTGALQAFFDDRFVNTSGDTMTGSLIVNIETGTVAIEANGIISGTTLRAQDLLTTSGSLIVEGSAIFNSTITIGGVEYTFPVGDGSASGKVLATDGAGNLSWTDGGETTTYGQGININNGSYISLNTTITGVTLQVSDSLASSGTLTVEGTSTFNDEVRFGSGIIINDITYIFPQAEGASGTVLGTDGNGNLTWTSAGQSYFAGQGLTLNGSNFLALNAAFTGTSLQVSGSLASSGTLAVEGSTTLHGTLSGNTIVGFNLTDCQGALDKIVYNAAAQRFECGTDVDTDTDTDTDTHFSGTGALQAFFDDRFVNTSGDTMTGSLIVNIETGTVAIEANGIISGTTLRAQDLLTTSGSLVVEGAATINGVLTLDADNIASYDANPTFTSDNQIVTKKYVDDNIISDTDTHFSGTGSLQNFFDSRYVSSAGDTMTGSLILNSTLTVAGLTTFSASITGTDAVFSGSVSGATLHASNGINSSGSLNVEGNTFLQGTLSGNTIAGFNLTDCNGSANKIVYNAANQRFECETDNTIADTDTTYTAGEGLELTGTVFSRNATLTGTSLQVSGSLASSGTLAVEGEATFNDEVRFGSGIIINDITYIFPQAEGLSGTVLGTDGNGNLTWTNGGSNTFAGQGLIKTGDFLALNAAFTGTSLEILGTASGRIIYAADSLNSSGALYVEGNSYLQGTLSGNTLEGFGLSNCTGGSKLLWNATTKRFECGADQTAGTGLDQNTADARYVEIGGDTMTGSLILNSTLTVAGLSTFSAAITGTDAVFSGTVSGASLYAVDSLNSSGTLAVEGEATFNDEVRFGSGIIINDITYIFPQAEGASGTVLGTDGNGNLTWTSAGQSYFAGQGLTLNGSNFLALNAAFTGTSLEILGTASGRIIYAADTLASSGTLVVEGAATFNSTVAIGGVTYIFPSSDGSASGKVLATDSNGNLSWTDGGETTAYGQGININNGSYISLNTTITGVTLQVSDSLASSGTLAVEGNTSIHGTLSGNTIVGFNLTDCQGALDKIVYNASAQRFECGTDVDTDTDTDTHFSGTGALQAFFDERFVNTSGDTMTGSLIVNIETGTVAIEANGIISGTTLRAQDLLTTSGSLIVEGSAIFNSTITIGGVEYTFPVGDGSASGRVLATDGAGNLSWTAAAAGGTTYYAGQGLTKNGSDFFSLNAAFTGTSLEIYGTASGRHIHAQDLLTSSGNLVVESSIVRGSGAATIIAAENQTGAYVYSSGAAVLALNAYQGTQSGTNAHIMFGYQNTFDVSLYRSGGSGSGGLVVHSDQTNGSLHAFRIVTDYGSQDNTVFHVTASGTVFTDGGLVINASGTLLVKGRSTFNDTVTFASGAVMSGHFLPQYTNTFDLGSSDKRWRDIYLSGGTIHLGDATKEGLISYNDTLSQIEFTAGNSNTPHFIIQSGAVMFEGTSVAASGTLVVEGISTFNNNVVFGSGLTINDITYIFPQAEGASGTVLGTDGNGNLTWTNAGESYFAGQGLTLNGSNFLALNAAFTGTSLQVSGSLASSGTLAVEGDTSIHGTLSGNTIVGFNLTDCQGALDKIVYNASAQRFECGTDVDTDTDTDTHFSGTGALQSFFDERFVNTSGDTMTGSLIVNIETGTVAIEANGIISGTTLRAQDLLTTSGSLIVEGSAIFNSTITIGGVEYTFPVGDGSASGKVLKTDGAGNLSWSDDVDTDTTYFAGQGLTLNGSNYFSLNAAFTGTSLEILGTASGRHLHAQDLLTSSGQVIFESTGSYSGAANIITVNGNSTGMLIDSQATTNPLLILNSVNNLQNASAASHILFGYNDLFDVNLYRYDADILRTDDDFYARLVSGTTLHAQDLLTTSGALVVEGAAVFNSTITIGGVTYTFPDSDGSASGKVLATDGAGNLSWTTGGGGSTSYAGQGLTKNGSDFFSLNAAFTGTSLEIYGTASGRHLHAQDKLTVSGSIVQSQGDPTHAGALLWGGGAQLFGANSVRIAGNYAYVTSYFSDSVEIADISDPTNPTHVGEITISDSAPLDGARGIAISGNYAYVAAYLDNAVVVLDISDPTDPTMVGSITDDSTTALDGARGITVVGKYAYVASSVDNGIEILDISDPTNPTHVGAITDGGSTELLGARGITVVGNYAYVASYSDDGVSIIDISDPTNPTHAGSITDNGTTELDGASSIVVIGRYAYVASEEDDGVSIIDISDPANPTHVGAITDDGTTELDGAYDITVVGNYAYIAAFDDSGVQVLDISDPTNPTPAGSITDNGTTELSGAKGIAVDGNYAYVAGYSDNGLEVLALNGTTLPTAEIGSLKVTALNVIANGNFNGNVAIMRALNVGAGLNVEGQTSMYAEFGSVLTLRSADNAGGSGTLTVVSGESQTGAYLNGSGAAILALDSYQGTQSGTTSHIMFGYQNVFDVSLYRSGGSNNGGMVLQTEQTTASQNAFRVITDYGSADNTVFRVSASGSVFTDADYSSTGADYAEWFKSGDTLQKGEVVCIDLTQNNAVVRCTSEADSNVMGIVSTNPAFVGNRISGADGIMPPGYSLIGLIGQVPTKVMIGEYNEEPLVIRPGDALTPSVTPGVARKALPGEPTVGVALEAFSGNIGDTGSVNVLISRRNSSVTVDQVEQKVLEQIASMEIEDEVQIMVADAIADINLDDEISTAVQSQIDSLNIDSAIDSRIAALDIDRKISEIVEDLGTPSTESGAMMWNIYETLKAQINDLSNTVSVLSGAQIGRNPNYDSVAIEQSLITGGDTRVGGDLYIDGALNVDDLFLSGLVKIDGSMDVGGTLKAASLDLASGATIHGALNIEGALLIQGQEFDLASLVETGATMELSNLMVREGLKVLGDVTIQGILEVMSGALVHGNLTVSGSLILNEDQAGYAVIVKTGTAVTIPFGSGAFPSIPIVTASSDDFTPWRIAQTTATGFTIETSVPATRDIRFSWHAALVKGETRIVNGLPGGATASDIPFHVDANGVPVSSSEIWNACIRSQQPLDLDGQPFNCRRYHDEGSWSHPDLLVQFLWDANVENKDLRLIVPKGYYVVVLNAEEEEEPEVITEEEVEPETEPETGTGETLTGTGETVVEETPAPETGTGETIIDEEPVETGTGETIIDEEPVETITEETPAPDTGTGDVLTEE